ncbi:trypsin-like peptidase domain-containing protein [Lutibacter citreus]|uniref:trypsin-like peptidase domain-containing protein n=1 Tax=Lutibacter citreus TaxID=2138210 RepID=UPI000DBE3EC9|nr:trypsin-like peptidase domain-containing protein [Lutibacter citreus]
MRYFLNSKDMNQEAIDLVINNVKILLSNDKIEESIVILKKEFAPISKDLSTPIILNSGSFKTLKANHNSELISESDYKVNRAKLKRNLLGIMDMVDTELETLRIMDSFKTIYTTTSKENLEKIQGPNNTLVPMSWVYKAIEVSKSVCQVIRADGTKGTGWLLENGWMITNHHVIPNANLAATSKIVFDYEEDIHGSNRKTSEFKLDPKGALFSSLLKLDYAYIKVIDNPANPLKKWGHLKVNIFSEPQIEHFVNIIQHPLGEKKQIALTRNNIVAIDNEKIFYKTDTEKGSSGAPVFDADWNVIALHHAGKTEEDGGLVVNQETGKKMGANEGILIKFVMEDIKRQQGTSDVANTDINEDEEVHSNLQAFNSNKVITPESFLEKARAQISDDPKTRLTFLVKTYLAEPDCVIDIHTHIFDKRCLSIRYILLRMLKSVALSKMGIEAVEQETQKMELLIKEEEEIYEEISQGMDDSDADWEKLEAELDKTVDIYENFEIFGFDVKEALQVLRKKNMAEVLDFYHDKYAITNLPEFSNSKMVIGILQMDLETGWGGTPRRNFKEQINDIKKISKERAIIPFLALDPRRADAKGKDENLYELFLDVFSDPNTPFFGVKCYPSLGYKPTDIRLDPIFKICAEKNIPVLTHCGGETVSTFKKTIRIKDKKGYHNYKIPGKKRNDRARYLNEPEHWEPVLEKYNNLKLNLGHFGGDDNWLNFGKFNKNTRIERIFKMMKNPNWKVYGDFSFNLVEDNLFKKFKDELDKQPDIAARTLYGTDYWVVLPAGDLLQEQDKFLKQLNNHKAAMLRDNTLKYLLD